MQLAGWLPFKLHFAHWSQNPVIYNHPPVMELPLRPPPQWLHPYAPRWFLVQNLILQTSAFCSCSGLVLNEKSTIFQAMVLLHRCQITVRIALICSMLETLAPLLRFASVSCTTRSPLSPWSAADRCSRRGIWRCPWPVAPCPCSGPEACAPHIPSNVRNPFSNN